MSKYEPLRSYLRGRGGEMIPMSFAEIEQVLGFKLPKSQMYPAWWSNNATNNVMTNEWLAAGYKTEQVDIGARKLVFRRLKPEARPVSPEGRSVKARDAKHPLIGCLKGMITIAPGVDLTEPADPEWAEIAWGEFTEKADSD